MNCIIGSLYLLDVLCIHRCLMNTFHSSLGYIHDALFILFYFILFYFFFYHDVLTFVPTEYFGIRSIRSPAKVGIGYL